MIKRSSFNITIISIIFVATAIAVVFTAAWHARMTVHSFDQKLQRTLRMDYDSVPLSARGRGSYRDGFTISRIEIGSVSQPYAGLPVVDIRVADRVYQIGESITQKSGRPAVPVRRPPRENGIWPENCFEIAYGGFTLTMNNEIIVRVLIWDFQDIELRTDRSIDWVKAPLNEDDIKLLFGEPDCMIRFFSK